MFYTVFVVASMLNQQFEQLAGNTQLLYGFCTVLARFFVRLHYKLAHFYNSVNIPNFVGKAMVNFEPNRISCKIQVY